MAVARHTPGSRRIQLSGRKTPIQARSRKMVDDILEASIRVLEREGASRFNTARVAEVAGVSVGSLYQYFPNKHALLFRLQQAEWSRTLAVLEAELQDTARPPAERLRRAITAFFRTEAEEASLRNALAEARADFRHLPEAAMHQVRVRNLVTGLLKAWLPGLSSRSRAFLAEFILVVIGAVAEEATGRSLPGQSLQRWSEATAEMLIGYLERTGLSAESGG